MQTLILILLAVLIAGILACFFYLRYAIKVLRDDIYILYHDFHEFRYCLIRFLDGEEAAEKAKYKRNK